MSLFKYTPAELYVLNKAPNALYEEALMLTLKDLSLKDVIDITFEPVTSKSSSARERLHPIINTFTHFETYSFKPHEKMFRNAMLKAGSKAMLRSVLTLIDSELHSETAYGKIVRRHKIDHCFNLFNWRLYTLSPSLNKNGKMLKQMLNLELRNHIDELKAALKEDPKKALELMMDLNGFLYLIPHKDLDEIIEILSYKNQTIRESEYSNDIYRWWLELDKLKEFDSYLSTKRNRYSASRKRWTRY